MGMQYAADRDQRRQHTIVVRRRENIHVEGGKGRPRVNAKQKDGTLGISTVLIGYKHSLAE
jgi:hypothetical protein